MPRKPKPMRLVGVAAGAAVGRLAVSGGDVRLLASSAVAASSEQKVSA